MDHQLKLFIGGFLHPWIPTWWDLCTDDLGHLAAVFVCYLSTLKWLLSLHLAGELNQTQISKVSLCQDVMNLMLFPIRYYDIKNRHACDCSLCQVHMQDMMEWEMNQCICQTESWLHHGRIMLSSLGFMRLYSFLLRTSQTQSNKNDNAAFIKAEFPEVSEGKLRGSYSQILKYPSRYGSLLSGPEQIGCLRVWPKTMFF